MRRIAKVDANQTAIVASLRACGATVQHLHQVGGGCPDIAVGFRGLNLFFEIKDGSQPPSRRTLTADETEWHAGWKGQVQVVESCEDAIAKMFAATDARSGWQHIADIARDMVQGSIK